MFTYEMRPSLTMLASPWRLHRGEGGGAVRIGPHLRNDAFAQYEDLMTPVDGEMWIDDEPVALVPDDLGARDEAVLLGGLEHLEHLLSVPTDLAGPEADPDDVRREHFLERREVALLDRLADVHHRRSS